MLFRLGLGITIRAMLTHEDSLETSLLLLRPGIVYTALERPSLRDLVAFEGAPPHPAVATWEEGLGNSGDSVTFVVGPAGQLQWC